MDTDFLILGIGAAARVLLGAHCLIDVPSYSLSSETVAQVNQTSIKRAEHQNLTNRMATQGANAERLSTSLDLLIDEELLIQRGEELNLVRLDSNVRTALITAVRNSIVSDQQARVPTKSELQDFFEANIALFSSPAQIQLRHIHLGPEASSDTLKELTSRFDSGEDFESLRTAFHNKNSRSIPPVPLSAPTLKRFLPETVAMAVVDAETDRSGPISINGSTYYFEIVRRIAARTATFDEVQIQVENEYAMVQEREAYQNYLKWLRNRASIKVQTNP